jgi:hypothetical protein
VSEQLRDLLQRAVPEAPEIRADDVPARAAAVRRRQVVAAGATLAVVAAAAVGVLALRDSQDGDGQVANDVPTTPSGSTAPYDVPVCPARIPDGAEENRALPDLAGVVAVRMCPDLHGFTVSTDLDPDARDRLADLDALVGDLDGFRDALAAAPTFDSARCATIDFIDDRESLMFVRADGTTKFVVTSMCAPVTTPSGSVDGGDLHPAFLTALDQQRDELDYAHPVSGDLTCDTSGFASPARPGREQLVEAIACDPADELVDTLDGDQLAALQGAWDDPQPVTADETTEDENDCLELDDAPAYLKAVTDRADIVHLFLSPCGYLVWDSWEPGQNAAIPISLEELGLR